MGKVLGGIVRAKVLIADDHRVFADGLCSLLSSSYEIVGIASDGRQLINMARDYKPDIIITDLSMPLLNGLDALRMLRKMGVRSKFVILTMHADLSLAVEVFRIGASAFVSKIAPGEELKAALEAALRGRSYLSPQFPCDLVTILAEAAKRPLSEDGPKLTRRQREVLQLVAEGKTMKEVAVLLNISTRTAESYKYDLMRTLGIRTNAELVQYAIRIGLITVPALRPSA